MLCLIVGIILIYFWLIEKYTIFYLLIKYGNKFSVLVY